MILEQGYLEEELARNLFEQIVDAVIECIEHGVIHGDIKSENIIVDLLTNKIKLIDFGSGDYCKVDFYTAYEGL